MKKVNHLWDKKVEPVSAEADILSDTRKNKRGNNEDHLQPSMDVFCVRVVHTGLGVG